MKGLAVPVLLLAVAFGYFFTQNPLLFGKRTGESHDGFTIFKHDAFLDDELFELRSSIGADFKAYRNHCLRVLTFANYFLPDSALKEIPEAMELVAVALAFHDVALWTDGKLAYLEPSVAQFEALGSDKYNEKQKAIIKDIIMEHHKITSFESGRGTAEDALVNAVRMGDWADASMGIVRYGLPASLLEAAYDAVPEAGFHKMLMNMGPKLSPGDIMGQLDVLSIFRW